MPINDFDGHKELSSQGERWVAIVPSDTVPLTEIPKAIWADVAGTVRLRGNDEHDETFNVVASSPIPLRPTMVLATGTNATGLKAIY